MEQLTFGTLLKLYRERGASGEGARWRLSQARFGERVEDVLGLAPGTYRAQVVSKWELDQTVIPASNRRLLTALIRILVLEQRIAVPSEADRLLNSGGYQSLTAEEITQFFPDEATSGANKRERIAEAPFEANTSLLAADQVTPAAPSREDARGQRLRIAAGWGLLTVALVAGLFGLASLTSQAPMDSGGSGIWLLITGGVCLTAAVATLWPVLPRSRWLSTRREPVPFRIVDDACGEKPFPLGHQRLMITAGLGAYFAELLEREPLYIELPGQIEATIGEATGLPPLQQLIWSLMDARGPQVVVLAGDGGFGKSTLAAKIVRCLVERQAVDLILGDSAKTQVVDPVTGIVTPLSAAFYSSEEFSARLSEQLGLPLSPTTSRGRMTQARDRLAGRRAVVVVDNLESVSESSELWVELRRLASRDVRVIVTTRSVSGLVRASGVGVVHLSGLSSLNELRLFIRWHIRAHSAGFPALARIDAELNDPVRLKRLLLRTGGSPLLIQLVVSDIARLSWSVLDQLPELFGPALLGYLYDDRWQELMQAGHAGLCACRILGYVANEQGRGKPVTVARLTGWLSDQGLAGAQSEALRMLQERFLLTIRGVGKGYLSVLPSLAQFVRVRSDEY